MRRVRTVIREDENGNQVKHIYWQRGPIDGPVERAERRARVAKSAAHQPADKPQKKRTPAEQSNYLPYSASEEEIAELSAAELEKLAIERRRELFPHRGGGAASHADNRQKTGNELAYVGDESMSPAELEAQAIARRKELNLRSLNGRS